MISLKATVTKIEERKSRVYVSGIGKFRDQSEGWWITFNGDFSIYVGAAKPAFSVGDRVTFNIAQE